jgi:hypothetical protein
MSTFSSALAMRHQNKTEPGAFRMKSLINTVYSGVEKPTFLPVMARKCFFHGCFMDPNSEGLNT